MSMNKNFSIDDSGYFGVTFLEMGSYGAHLMSNRVLNTVNVSHLHFDDATTHYFPERQALTIEGDARTISTPHFAVESLTAYARIARDMDELAQPFAS